MKRTPLYTLMLSLPLALCAAPLSDAFAGQTVTINGDVGGNVVGNGNPATTAASPTYPDNYLDPNNNEVIVNSGSVGGDVYGGYASSNSGSATVTGNSVTINGGSVGGDVYGGRGNSNSGSVTVTVTASGNTVTINGGSVGNNVYGGYANSTSGSATAIATGNTVTINGGTVGDGGNNIFGGYADSGGSATVTGNSMTINGGTVTGSVSGGGADSNGSGSATATGNSVTINGGTMTGTVYGGIARSYAQSGGSATATHNTVTISGNTKFDGSNSHLYGGYALSLGGGTTDLFTGNTLNVWNYTGTPVVSVQYFEFYNFVLPASRQGLTVSGEAVLNDGGSRGSTITGISTLGGTAPVRPGERVTLVSAGTLNTNNFDATQKVTGLHGATLVYDWALDTANNQLTATPNTVRANPRAKALSEGFLSGLALINQGADLVANQGMGNAVNVAHGEGGNGFGVFAALSSGWSRYDTGSHSDMSSFTLMTGLALGAKTAPGRLTLGAFLEYGNGSYDTHNSFSNAASVDGNGDAYYFGGGILGRMDFTDTGPGRFYAEASARMGKIHNDYAASGLRDALGRSADYDSSSLYYSAHAGLGYIWNITSKASLDVYGKYFWTRQESDSITLSTNDPVRFHDADSSRLRVGTRFVYAVNEAITPYVGVAWEHEFDGRAHASTYGYSIDSPSLRGDTGIGEIGMTFKPSPTLPLSLDLGIQGYLGTREGVTGALQVRYQF